MFSDDPANPIASFLCKTAVGAGVSLALDPGTTFQVIEGLSGDFDIEFSGDCSGTIVIVVFIAAAIRRASSG